MHAGLTTVKLNYSERIILVYLAERSNERHTYAQIAQACGIPASTVGHAVRRLVEAGYVATSDRKARSGYRYTVKMI